MLVQFEGQIVLEHEAYIVSQRLRILEPDSVSLIEEMFHKVHDLEKRVKELESN